MMTPVGHLEIERRVLSIICILLYRQREIEALGESYIGPASSNGLGVPIFFLLYVCMLLYTTTYQHPLARGVKMENF